MFAYSFFVAHLCGLQPENHVLLLLFIGYGQYPNKIRFS